MTNDDRLVRIETALAQIGFALYHGPDHARRNLKSELAEIMQLHERRLREKHGLPEPSEGVSDDTL